MTRLLNTPDAFVFAAFKRRVPFPVLVNPFAPNTVAPNVAIRLLTLMIGEPALVDIQSPLVLGVPALKVQFVFGTTSPMMTRPLVRAPSSVTVVVLVISSV